MSIQSEINRISSEVETQADLIEQIKTALIGKVGGGGGNIDELINRTITEVSSNSEAIGDYVFYGCTRLESITLPMAESIRGNAFYNCVALKSVEVPNVTSIGDSAFRLCAVLPSIDLPLTTSISSNAFRNCNKLQSIILRSETVCTLGTNVFTSTPIASGTGYIYVPSALVDSYKSETNWATYAAQIRAIEDYPEIIGG